MSDAQAQRLGLADRFDWWDRARRPRAPTDIPGRWYAENTREPIRDETFRVWKEYGALLEDALPPTSSAPRYRLARDFADLFDPSLPGIKLQTAVMVWQQRHLTPAARARLALLRQQVGADTQVRFPDGNTRLLAIGPSTPLLKGAVEAFVPRYLHQPVVLVVTESRRRLAYEDAAQLRRIRLKPDPRIMPDLLVADVGAPDGELRLVFMECVATGGAMSRERVAALRSWLAENRLSSARVAFGTVFRDRSDPVFRRLIGELGWGTFVWFVSEPENLLVLLRSGGFEPRRALDDMVERADAAG